MNLRFLSCRKYRRLSYIQRDRDLNVSEVRFMGEHETVCDICAPQMQLGFSALNMLRDSAMEPEYKPTFDERVIRRVKVETVRASMRYWSPAMIGAAVAGLVVLAAMQMIAQSSQLPSFHVPNGEARVYTPAFPHTLDTGHSVRSLNQ